MQAAGLRPNEITYNSLITACAKTKPSARVDDAMGILKDMQAAGLRPNEYSLLALLKCCTYCRPKRPDLADTLFRELVSDVFLNDHVKKALTRAVGAEKASPLIAWAFREFPQCQQPRRRYKPS